MCLQYFTSLTQMPGINFSSFRELDNNCPPIFILSLYTGKVGQLPLTRGLIYSANDIFMAHMPHILCHRGINVRTVTSG